MPRGRIGGLSISELKSMLEQRKRDLTALRKERAALQKELAKVERRIESLGGGRTRGARPRNAKSLTALLEETLQKASKPLSVGEIVEKVQSAGYRSTSPNFRGIVNQTLIKEDRFVSAGRGMYQLKK